MFLSREEMEGKSLFMEVSPEDAKWNPRGRGKSNGGGLRAGSAVKIRSYTQGV